MTAALRLRLQIRALLLALLAGLGLGARASTWPAPVVIERAIFESPAGAQVVALPHQIDPAVLGSRGREVVYRLELDLPAPPTPAAPLAVYVPKLSLAARLSVNGRPGGSCALAPLADARCLHQPQLFVPPVDSWRAGRNELTFELFGNNRQPSGMAQVQVGDAHRLSQLHAQRYLWQVELLHLLTVALLTVSLLSLAAALEAGARGKRRQTYVLLGLAGIVNALCDLNMLIVEPPVDFELYSWFTYVARLESMPLYFLTLLSFYGVLRPRVLWGCVAAMVAMAAAVWLSGNSRVVVQMLYLPLGLAATAAFAYTVWVTWRSRRADHRLMVAVSVVLLAAGWWDFVKVQGGLAFERVYLLPYAYPATLLVMGALLASWLRQALAAQRELNRSLEERLAEREAQLRQAWADMREAEQRRVREEERAALALHMHDGLGSQLVTARAALAAGEIDAERAARILSECSDDLRLILTTLHEADAGLARCVADFRYRLDQRLADTPLRLEWTVALRDAPPVSAAQTLNLLRILQEAVGNALRHARARRLRIHLVWTPAAASPDSADAPDAPDRPGGLLELRVADDGIGFVVPPADGPQRPGLGGGLSLFTLRKRAAELGAELAVASGTDGTSVTLRWRPADSPA